MNFYQAVNIFQSRRLCVISRVFNDSGDTLGVMRTSAGILHFFINGQDQGVAANSIPANVYAVVDIYGKCMQVTVNSASNLNTTRGSCK